MIPNKTTYDKRTAAQLLRDPSTFGSTILAILVQAYGAEVLDWDPLEIYARVSEDFSAIIPEDGENRLNAMMVCATSDSFYKDPDVFRAVCTCLYDGDLGDLVSGALEDISVAEMLWAIYEAGLLHDSPIGFSSQVQDALEQELRQEAFDGEEGGYEEFVEAAKAKLREQLAALNLAPEAMARIG